jgi:NADH:ubiquinone oxidoreductase subunit 6 (subunit J)
MFGNVLTYDAYHLALYLLTALAWGVLGLWFLMSGGRRGVAQVLRHVGVALLINGFMLMLDIWRVLDHAQVEAGLLAVGVVLPIMLILIYRTGFSK